jgi:hypothetical protein
MILYVLKKFDWNALKILLGRAVNLSIQKCGRPAKMRYRIVEIKNKEKKVTIKCLDSQEQALLRVSLSLDTFECTDPFIPDGLKRFIESNLVSIRKILLTLNQVHKSTPQTPA